MCGGLARRFYEFFKANIESPLSLELVVADPGCMLVAELTAPISYNDPCYVWARLAKGLEGKQHNISLWELLEEQDAQVQASPIVSLLRIMNYLKLYPPYSARSPLCGSIGEIPPRGKCVKSGDRVVCNVGIAHLTSRGGGTVEEKAYPLLLTAEINTAACKAAKSFGEKEAKSFGKKEAILISAILLSAVKESVERRMVSVSAPSPSAIVEHELRIELLLSNDELKTLVKMALALLARDYNSRCM